MDAPPHQSPASGVDLRRRNPRFEARIGIKARGRHSERPEDLLIGKSVESNTSNRLEHELSQDHLPITIYGSGSGDRLERPLVYLLEILLAPSRRPVKRRERLEAPTMCHGHS